MTNDIPQNWIEVFAQRHGRAPRILHVGNVAGNAYQNAKILNAAGADCDVLCADYYHAMGCPEWEDADFSESIQNLAFPPWHKFNLHGFKRPRWYAAAPRRLAIAYLLAKRGGTPQQAQKAWRRMETAYRYLCWRENSSFKKLLMALEQCTFRLLALLRGDYRARKPAASPAAGENPLVQRVMDDAKRFFPERHFSLDEHWNTEYTPEQAALYAPLFACYDIVQAYATDPIWPYLCGVENVVAFEHGTLRDMPRDDSDTAHLAMLAYANSKAIMLTNTDCVESAEIITEHSRTPIIYGLHGIAVEQIAGRMEAQPPPMGTQGRFGVPLGIPVFYCPSRHTFNAALGGFIKGNDLVVEGAALLADESLDFRLVLASWGEDVGRIRQMVEAHPTLAEKVIWTPALDKHAFSETFMAVDGVLDQFTLPVFGGIAFEVLAGGHAVLISKHVAEARMRQFFGSPMPYFACNSAEDIAAAMRAVCQNPPAARQKARDAKAWVLRAHSNARILEKNLACYQYIDIPVLQQ